MLVHREITYDNRVQREARALEDAGHSVTVVQLGAVVASARPGGYGFALVAVEPATSLKRWVPLKGYRLLFGLSVIRAALRTRPQAVHAHDAAMLAPAYAIARLARARLVYDTHELAIGVPYRTRGWALVVRIVERIFVPRSDAVITVSDGIARRLSELYRLKRHPVVVRNLPESVEGAEAPAGDLREALGIGSAPLILHQGASALDRGCEALIASLPHLPGAHVVFLGGGEKPYLDSLRDVAESTGVAERVHFVPSVVPEELLAHTRQADVGTTLLEDNCENHRLALPNKVFEYIAAGVPVVSNDLPELRALIEEHQVGSTVAIHDAEALARALEGAILKRGDAGLAARLERTTRELSWERERSRLTGLYATLG